MQKVFGISLVSLVILLLFCTPVMAQNATVTNGTEGNFAEQLQVLWGMLVSYVIAALVWAFSGFFKVKDPKEDTFDPVQFFTTMIIGFITGILAFAIYMVTGESLQPETIVGYLLAVGFVGFVETWVKVFWRRIKPYFTPPEETPAVT